MARVWEELPVSGVGGNPICPPPSLPLSQGFPGGAPDGVEDEDDDTDDDATMATTTMMNM